MKIRGKRLLTFAITVLCLPMLLAAPAGGAIRTGTSKFWSDIQAGKPVTYGIVGTSRSQGKLQCCPWEKIVDWCQLLNDSLRQIDPAVNRWVGDGVVTQTGWRITDEIVQLKDMLANHPEVIAIFFEAYPISSIIDNQDSLNEFRAVLDSALHFWTTRYPNVEAFIWNTYPGCVDYWGNIGNHPLTSYIGWENQVQQVIPQLCDKYNTRSAGTITPRAPRPLLLFLPVSTTSFSSSRIPAEDTFLPRGLSMLMVPT